MSDLPILYSFVRCPYAMRARIALVEVGINCILREVNLKDKPKHLLEISPKATVPVLLLPDGTIIEESLDIVTFAAEKSENLNPKKYSEVKQEEIRSLINENDTEFVRNSRIYKYPDRYPEESAEECRRNIESLFLRKYEKMLEDSPYLLGEKSIADIALLPFVRQFAKVDEKFFFNSNYKNTIRWLESFTESDDFKNIVMAKNSPWQPQDTIIELI